jgi:hypothetical protein
MIPTRKGQSLAETAIILGVLGLICLALWAVIGPGLSEAMAEAVGNISLDLSNSHAAEKHGTGIIAQINQCFDKNGTMVQMIRSDGRRAEICKMDNGKYAVRILEDNGTGGWRMVTEFIKDKMKTLDEVFRYLSNSGYTPLQ